MCVKNPVPFHSDKPIIAYKVMLRMYQREETHVRSRVAGNEYRLGFTYFAEQPLYVESVLTSEAYSCGFHAYAHLIAAKNILLEYLENSSGSLLRLVEVELSDITHKGWERNFDTDCNMKVYVAKQCKFIRIIEV